MAKRTSSLRRHKARSPYQIVRDEISEGGYKRYGMSVLVASTFLGWAAYIVT